jgi:ATP-dependent Clp protease ATP-binding subunit ClpA
LTNKNIRLNLTESAIDYLAEQGYDNKMGARPLGRKIDELIRVPLSKRILFDRLENCIVHADVIADEIKFLVDSTPLLPGVNQQGFIILNEPQV